MFIYALENMTYTYLGLYLMDYLQFQKVNYILTLSYSVKEERERGREGERERGREGEREREGERV